jgi:hypothetical protein
MSIGTLLTLFVLLFVCAKAWRFFIETSDDLQLIRFLEPWFWFLFMNLALSLITSNYDYPFVVVGVFMQLALSAWFAISTGWIVQNCQHPMVVFNQSWFVRGKIVKFCYRCGTRVVPDRHDHAIKTDSWQMTLFQVPPHLFEYVLFWLVQSLMVLVSFFFVLRFLEKPELQNKAVIAAVVLVVLVPPLIYFLGRFRGYLSKTQGLIWWQDLKSSILSWTAVILILWFLVFLVTR